MKSCFILIIVYSLFLFSLPVKAQDSFAGWYASFNTIKTGKKTSIHAEAQFRSTNQFQQLQNILLRGGFNYHLKKNMILTAGYGYILKRREVNIISAYGHEHRIWQQFLLTHSVKKILVSHRFRLEERFNERVKFENNQYSRDGYTYSTRFRYFFRNIIPFTKEPVFKKGMFGAFQNEVFVNVSNRTNVNGKFFDQNRLYLASGYRFSRQFDIEAGYMYLYISGLNKSTAKSHILQLASYLRL